MQHTDYHIPFYTTKTSYSHSYIPSIDELNTSDYKPYTNIETENQEKEYLKSNSNREIKSNDSMPDYLGIPERSNLIDAINFDLKKSPVYFY